MSRHVQTAARSVRASRAERMAALSLVTLLSSAVSEAASFDFAFPDIYKPPAAVRKGLADVASVASKRALVTNPAGLAEVPAGWGIAPLDLSLVSSHHAAAFVRELGDSLNIDDADMQRQSLVELLRGYRGRSLHADVNVMPAATWRRGRLAAGVAWLGSIDLDARTHEGFGERGLLDIDARSLSGPLAGFAFDGGRWRAGLGIKRLRRHRVARSYSVRELVELTQAGREIADERAAGSDVAFDLGFQYEMRAAASGWQPRLGVVVRNAGGLDFGAAGRIRPTVSVGASVNLPVERIAALEFNVEYFDLLHRLPQDDDHDKRIRLGAEWRLWDRPRGALVLGFGAYQRAYTAGVEWRRGGFRIGLATYGEELGAFAGQDNDRRYVVHFGFELRAGR